MLILATAVSFMVLDTLPDGERLFEKESTLLIADLHGRRIIARRLQ
jgi:hypothetical protein